MINWIDFTEKKKRITPAHIICICVYYNLCYFIIIIKSSVNRFKKQLWIFDCLYLKLIFIIITYVCSHYSVFCFIFLFESHVFQLNLFLYPECAWYTVYKRFIVTYCGWIINNIEYTYVSVQSSFKYLIYIN